MQNYYKQFDSCREHDIPACADACPFKADLLTIQERITKNRFNAAYKSLRDSVVFPGIVSELCPAYCEKACVREAVDTPVQIRRLEKAIIAHTARKAPNRYNLPAKPQRIAVIGAGLSGMGFAFRMASKKYDVSIFEKSTKIGGHLAGLMEEAIYLEEFALQFQHEKYSLFLNTEITDLHKLCKEKAKDAEAAANINANTEKLKFDVIYIATGKGGRTFDVPLPDNSERGGAMRIGDTAVFLGGELCGKDLMHALADGLKLSASAENFLKTGSLERPKQDPPTGCMPDRDRLAPTPAITAAGPFFTQEECIAEAERCIRCRCDTCVRHCDLVDYYDKMPIKMRDEIFLSCKPAGSLVHKSPARKYVAACTMCGMLEEACPEHIDLCSMVKFARHKMHEANKVPTAYRQYFLRDMAFANGEYAALKRPAPGTVPKRADTNAKPHGSGKAYAFFPGCNLGALDPDYVIKPYKWLLSKNPGTSLLLRCCSVPVDWNGESALHEEEIKNLRQDWESLGRPILIMACMSCLKHIAEYLPEIEAVSLYEIFVQWGFSTTNTARMDACAPQDTFAIFDPCSARNRKEVQASVRELLSDCGMKTAELPKADCHGCCGFGGMGSIAAPDFTEYVAQRRTELSENPYIVYCANCRDIFTDRNKKAIHLLDLLFGIDPAGQRTNPDVTQRRKNRITLKQQLLKEIWKEEADMKPYETPFSLHMKEEVRKKADKRKILEEDICAVISNAEATGRKTLDPQTGHYKAYLEIGHITCWVEYGPPENGQHGYEIHNLYTHRMKIELEAVWNGRKTDINLR